MVEIDPDAVGQPVMEGTVNRKPWYTKYHPKWYRTRIPIFWWVHKLPHIRFIARELTSVAVALYACILLYQISAVADGPEAYVRFLEWLKTPFSVLLHAVAFLFVLFHSITWFNLAPKALVVSLGSKRVPPQVIVVLNYAAWIILSLGISWILLK
ncbi:fumarate reductase subunit C [bacterium]|nr:fumarate reductase subunit C [bacterium]MCI0603203.1 fumarate reductase subunit C [bacterium]